MVVVWGLDLREIKWSKFSHRNMWSDTYHLRRTKFIVYQAAMILCVVSESLGTAALSDYLNQQSYVQQRAPQAHVHNDSFIGAFSYNIFVGIYVATIFGAAFFFDLFWPERKESEAVKYAWRVCSVLAPLLVLSSALLLTVIFTRYHASISGVSPTVAAKLLAEYNGSPLEYLQNKRALASVVFMWLGLPATVASTILLWISYSYNERHRSPIATHIQEGGDAEAKAKDSHALAMAWHEPDILAVEPRAEG